MRDEPILSRHRVELEVSIRPCRADDVPLLEWGQAYRSHRAAIARAFERHLRGEGAFIVADLRGFPVGQVWIDLARRRAEGIAILWALRVMPGLRSLGIGGALVRGAEQLARERGFARAEIGAEHDNPGARRLYERLGYEAVGEESGWVESEGEGGEIVREQIRYAILRRDLETRPQRG